MEHLDILHDIISRFSQSHKIILCGDLNGTLLPSRANAHDILLRDFVQEHHLINKKQPGNKANILWTWWRSFTNRLYINDRRIGAY